MRVSSLKKLTNGRYKVTFDNGSDLILFEEVIVNNVILIGKTIDSELQEKLAEENYKATAYHQTLNYIDIRMRSSEEVRLYLLKKEYDEPLIYETIEKLTKDGYINDEAFAKAYIHDRLNLSNDGINKIRKSLTNYKINDNIIDNVISNIDINCQNTKIDKLINRQIRLNTKYTGNVLKNKILNYLINLGYEYNVILEKLNNQEFENSSNIHKDYKKIYDKYANKYSGYKLEMMIRQKLSQKGYSDTDIYNVTKKGFITNSMDE